VFQSSGYGKTKLVYEMAKKHPTIFICLRDIGDSGYPLRSYRTTQFKTYLTDGSANNLVSSMVNEALDTISSIKEEINPANEGELALEFMKTQPWNAQSDLKLDLKLSDKIISNLDMEVLF
jgi:hypothetical protein